jgi:D-ribose pyranose/furanose isomerase RbsD
MISITKTSALLHISKFRLLKLLEQENIVPQKNGNKKLLSEDQINHLRNVIEQSRNQDDLFIGSVNEQITKSATTIDLSVHQEIVKDLKETIEFLKEQLEAEKRERSELSKGILAVQAQVFKVQQSLEVKPIKRESFIQRMFSFS